MTGPDRPVETYYAVTDLGDRILDALTEMGKDLEALTPADLARVDQFHIRGREATEELARIAEVKPDTRVLDAGCGLGGSARYLVSEFGCRVVGLDLTREYCRVATMLSSRVGLADRIEFRHGSATDMPFDDASFDMVWTEHTQMNIPDKKAFYSEIARVLAPAGQLVFHDVFTGANGAPLYPVPWAGDSSISFLCKEKEARELLVSLGFTVRHWEDTTARSLAFFQRSRKKLQRRGPPPLGLHLLMGAEARRKFENMTRCLAEGRIVVTQAVLVKGG